MVRVSSVRYLRELVLEIGFDDGTRKELDMTPYLRGPVFEPLLRDPALFANVRVDPALGTICWANGADICPDVLYEGRRPASWDVGP